MCFVLAGNDGQDRVPSAVDGHLLVRLRVFQVLFVATRRRRRQRRRRRRWRRRQRRRRQRWRRLREAAERRRRRQGGDVNRRPWPSAACAFSATPISTDSLPLFSSSSSSSSSSSDHGTSSSGTATCSTERVSFWSSSILAFDSNRRFGRSFSFLIVLLLLLLLLLFFFLLVSRREHFLCRAGSLRERLGSPDRSPRRRRRRRRRVGGGGGAFSSSISRLSTATWSRLRDRSLDDADAGVHRFAFVVSMLIFSLSFSLSVFLSLYLRLL